MGTGKDPGCKVPPGVPNAYPVDWPADGFTGTPPPVTFRCESGYTLTGDAKLRCGVNETWYGNAACVPWDITQSGWFWAVVASLLTLVTLGIIAITICCYKKACCRRNRIRSKGSEEILDDCCHYGGSCDVCGCIDYSGCCSLTGCCGYQGACAPWCTFCRCCREPDDKHLHKHISTDISENSRTRLKRMNKLSVKDLDKSRLVWTNFKARRNKNVIEI